MAIRHLSYVTPMFPMSISGSKGSPKTRPAANIFFLANSQESIREFKAGGQGVVLTQAKTHTYRQEQAQGRNYMSVQQMLPCYHNQSGLWSRNASHRFYW